jgi:hypothetical protein
LNVEWLDVGKVAELAVHYLQPEAAMDLVLRLPAHCYSPPLVELLAPVLLQTVASFDILPRTRL